MGPTTSTSGTLKPDADYPFWVIRSREDPAIRSALRAGGIDSMAHRAYPYLARYWDGAPYLREPLLLHGSAAGGFLQVGQAKNAGGIGQLTNRLSQLGLLSPTTASARLLSVQQMPLRNAHRVFFSLLHFADGNRIRTDWAALYGSYRQWDHPNRTIRLRTRRQILEEFYSPSTRATKATQDQTTEKR